MCYAVFQVDDTRVHAALGFTARAPRWAMAFKFAPKTTVTVLESITVQVGVLTLYGHGLNLLV